MLHHATSTNGRFIRPYRDQLRILLLIFFHSGSFVDELLRDLTAYQCTKETASPAAKIDCEQQAQGETIPFSDLLVGVTALEPGLPLLTVNGHHSGRVPDLPP